MARTKMAAKPTQAAAEAAPEHDSAITPAAEAASATATLERRPPASDHAATEASAGQPVYAADPHEKISISLSDIPGGPAMHLLRSHRYRQMQIKFQGEQPDEQQQARLKQLGWTDRTESEGVYTKQIDPDKRWQSVQKMELEFRDVANAIRKDKQLEPVLMEGLGA